MLSSLRFDGLTIYDYVNHIDHERGEQFCALTGAAASDPVTPEQAAKAILAERLCDTMFLNQIDTETQRSLADRFAAALGGSGLRIAAGSLRAGSGWLYPDI